MTRQADLEAALRASWDAEHLAVYADELQGRGDPRGELIAIDLALDRNAAPESPELLDRRAELLHQLLGGLATQPEVTTSHGFVTLEHPLDVATLDAVLCSPLGPYVRVLTVDGDGARIAASLTTLGLVSRPWLERLVLFQRGAGDGNVPRAVVDAVIRATPHLRELDIAGQRLLPAFPHPTVTHARISGIDVLLSLITTGPPGLPAVTSLDLGFVHAWPMARWDRASVLLASQLPALRRLDLTRNAAPANGTIWRELDLFRILRTLPIAPQLESLRLPMLIDADDLANVQYALDRMPNLHELEVVQCAGAKLLTHVSARLMTVAS